jgi:hypothetical protein
VGASGARSQSIQLMEIHRLSPISAKSRQNLTFYVGLPGFRLARKDPADGSVRGKTGAVAVPGAAPRLD